VNEEWKPMPGFEGYYLISNRGNVWSVRTSKLLKIKTTNAGYARVTPCVNGYRKECAVHRLVALAFIPNPENKPTVNHKNENKLDNRVENLEWATNAEQNVYGTRIERVRASTDYKNRGIDYAAVAAKHDYSQINKNQMKSILQFTKGGIFIAQYAGLALAARTLNINQGHLCECLQGRRKSCGGYQWKYA